MVGPGAGERQDEDVCDDAGIRARELVHYNESNNEGQLVSTEVYPTEDV